MNTKRLTAAIVLSACLVIALAPTACQGGSESDREGEASGEHIGSAEAGGEHNGGGESSGEHSGGSESSGEHGGSESGEHDEEGEESGAQFGLRETFDQVRAGARLVISYHEAANAFMGTVENTTEATLNRVRVEVHLSNGIELGPTTPINLAPGQVIDVTLQATSESFATWSAHPEVN